MFRERLLVTQQRLLRSEMFTLKGLKSKGNQMKSSEICTIESLLGSTGKKVLFGVLTQVSLSFLVYMLLLQILPYYAAGGRMLVFGRYDFYD